MIPTAPAAGRMPTPTVAEHGAGLTLEEIDARLENPGVYFDRDELLGLHGFLDRLRLAADRAYMHAQYGTRQSDISPKGDLNASS